MATKRSLAIPAGKSVKKPVREPDHYSKRGVPYWWAPEWVRGSGNGYGRIMPIRVNQHATDLYMVSKDGNATYIQGSIQKEFQQWHEDQEIDFILLGVDISSLMVTNWEYES